jgi:hypothetical protein
LPAPVRRKRRKGGRKPGPKAQRTAAAPPTGRRSAIASEDWAAAVKRVQAGEKIPAVIADYRGMKYNALYMRVKKEPKPARNGKAAAAAPEHGDEALRRRCEECGNTTSSDPCHRCGTPWNRKK